MVALVAQAARASRSRAEQVVQTAAQASLLRAAAARVDPTGQASLAPQGRQRPAPAMAAAAQAIMVLAAQAESVRAPLEAPAEPVTKSRLPAVDSAVAAAADRDPQESLAGPVAASAAAPAALVTEAGPAEAASS
jgi:hypothetical protein